MSLRFEFFMWLMNTLETGYTYERLRSVASIVILID
jgi:hypothetical protein